MGTFIIYIIKWAFALTLLYSLYGLFLRRETFHRINRMVLLFILASSMLLPFCNIELAHTNPITDGAQRIEQVVKEEAERKSMYMTQIVHDAEEGKAAEAYDAHRSVSDSSSIGTETDDSSSPFPWVKALLGIYLVGLVLHILLYIKDFTMLTYIIYKGKHVKIDGIPQHYHVIVTPRALMPMSWMRWILVNEQDLQEPCLLQHELAHLHKGHSWDLLLSELTARLQWFNPLAWMLCHDLRNIHEYEVDRELVNEGTDREAYGRIIIERATQTTLQSVTNGLKHSAIRDRLKMLYTKPSGRLAWLKVLYLVPLIGLSIIAFAKPGLIGDIRQQLESDGMMEVSNVLNLTIQSMVDNGAHEADGFQSEWNWKEAEYYVYCQDSTKIDMDCEILKLYSGGKKFGEFYGNSDEFMDCREGFYPGFYVLDVRNLERDKKHISFSISAENKRFLNAPVSLQYTSHLDALSHEAYEPWLQMQSVLDIQEATFIGTFVKDGIWLNNNSLYPHPRQFDKKFFRKVKREELEAYGLHLLDKEERASNSFNVYGGGWLRNEADVVVTRQSKVYNLLEIESEGYVCYAQDYLFIPSDEGRLMHFSAAKGQGFVHPIGREKQDISSMPPLSPNPDFAVVLFQAPSFDSPVTGGIALNKNSCFESYPCLGYENGFFKMELTGAPDEPSGGVHYVSDRQMDWSPTGIGWAN